MEEWSKIKRYPNYEISNEGRVRNKNTGHVLSPRTSNGYHTVNLFNGYGASVKYVHRLVADAFYDGDHDGLDVNHLDGCKTNNHVDNLQWCTRSENLKHAYEIGVKKPSGANPIRPIRVVETGKVYPTIRECARDIDGDHRHIHKCLHGERNTHHNYHFEYA